MKILCREDKKGNCSIYIATRKWMKRFLCSIPYNASRFTIVRKGITKNTFANDTTLDVIEWLCPIKTIEEDAFKESGIKMFCCVEVKNKKEAKVETTVTFTSGSKGNLTIQHNAFLNCHDLHTVILPEVGSTLRIEADAFAGCESLRTVVLSLEGNPTVSISPDAFRGCRNLAIVGSANEVVQSFAREQGFEYVCVS